MKTQLHSLFGHYLVRRGWFVRVYKDAQDAKLAFTLLRWAR